MWVIFYLWGTSDGALDCVCADFTLTFLSEVICVTLGTVLIGVTWDVVSSKHTGASEIYYLMLSTFYISGGGGLHVNIYSLDKTKVNDGKQQNTNKAIRSPEISRQQAPLSTRPGPGTRIDIPISRGSNRRDNKAVFGKAGGKNQYGIWKAAEFIMFREWISKN